MTGWKAPLWGPGKGSWERQGYKAEANRNPSRNTRQRILYLKGYSITQLLQGPDSLWSSFDRPRLQELQEGKGITGPMRGTKLSSAPDRDAFSCLRSLWLPPDLRVRQTCFAPHPSLWMPLCCPRSKGTAVWQQRVNGKHSLTAATFKNITNTPSVSAKLFYAHDAWTFKGFLMKSLKLKHRHFSPRVWSPLCMRVQGKHVWRRG